MLFRERFKFEFSWPRMAFIGLFASFNKTLTGGGYGPVVTLGQVLSGLETKKSVAVTALSESLVSLVAVVVYFSFGVLFDVDLLFSLIVGSLLSIPLSVYFVKKVHVSVLGDLMGLAAVLFGVYLLFAGFF